MSKNNILIPVWALALLLISCAHNNKNHINRVDDNTPLGQLPHIAEPISYKLSLNIDPNLNHFSGITQIKIRLLKSTRHFWIHGQDLSVSQATLSGSPVSYQQVTKDGVVKISSARVLNAGEYLLKIKYEAPYSTGLSGLYKVVENEIPYIFTQFEPIAARLCFPGFDEPRFKTPFEFEILTPSNLAVITNTPETKNTLQKNQTLHKFSETRPLPSYLIAFAVGDFDIVEAKSIEKNTVRNREIPFRGVAAKGKGKLLKYALQNTPKFLNYLENYTKIAYPYEKLDIIAVPDFASGAMENAGAITFREYLLLIDEQQASVEQKRSFAYVMAHELAHQWFGNLVTMPWWNDLWLNEAFATWAGYKTLEHTNPEMLSHLTLLTRAHGAMDQDALKVARRIREPILSNHDISNAFDSITYSKGAAVLKMFESFMGEKSFQQAVQNYLKTYKDKTAVADNFISSVDKFSKTRLTPAFWSYIEQPGLPYVTAQTSSDGLINKITLSQERFSPAGSTINKNQLWDIPICIESPNLSSCFILNKKQTEVILSKNIRLENLELNKNANGYFLYNINNQSALASPSRLSKLNSREQMSLMKNLNFKFQKGLVSRKQYLELSKDFILKSKHRFSFSLALPTLRFMHRHLEFPKSKIKKHVLKNANSLLKTSNTIEFGVTEKNILKNQTDNFLVEELKSLGGVKEKQLLRAGKGYLENILQNKNTKFNNPSMAGTSLALALAHSDETLYYKLEEKLTHLNNTITRNHIIHALASTEDKSRSEYLLSKLLTRNFRKNEYLNTIWQHQKSSQNQTRIWEWFKENKDTFIQNIPTKRLGNLPYIAHNFCSSDKAEEVQKYFAPYIQDLNGGPPALTEVVESITNCANLKRTQLALN